MTPEQFRFRAREARRTLPHGKRPTDLHVRIGLLLANWQDAWPSHAKLARAARCCVRTVQNALKRFRGLGMLSWTHRGKVTRSGRRLQLSNHYHFDASFLLKSCLLHVGKLQLPLRPLLPVRTVAQQIAILMAG